MMVVADVFLTVITVQIGFCVERIMILPEVFVSTPD